MTATVTATFLQHRRSLMWSLMRIVRDPQAAEDLAQEAYLRVSQAAESEPIEHIEAFLHQTARNLALDHVRRRRRRAGVEVESISDALVEQIPAHAPSVEAAIIERERFQRFKDALGALPERAQSVVVLSRVNGWTNARIAAHLGVSERTVFNDLKLAMAHCRDALLRLDCG